METETETPEGGDRRRFWRRKEDKEVKVQTSPRYYRDIMIMFTLALVLGLFGFSLVKFDNIASDLRDANESLTKQADSLQAANHSLLAIGRKVIKANINGCKGQNVIRTILRRDKQYQIDQSHSTDYSAFFPDVDPEVLHRAIHKQNVILHDQIRTDLRGRPCHALYPKP